MWRIIWELRLKCRQAFLAHRAFSEVRNDGRHRKTFGELLWRLVPGIDMNSRHASALYRDTQSYNMVHLHTLRERDIHNVTLIKGTARSWSMTHNVACGTHEIGV